MIGVPWPDLLHVSVDAYSAVRIALDTVSSHHHCGVSVHNSKSMGACEVQKEQCATDCSDDAECSRPPLTGVCDQEHALASFAVLVA